MLPYICYIIGNEKKRTYIGSTNDFRRRIRQHNGEITGGAKATRGKGPWSPVCIVKVTDETKTIDHVFNLSLEWHMKHPMGYKVRKGQPRGMMQRITCLQRVINHPKFINYRYEIFCDCDPFPFQDERIVIKPIQELWKIYE